MPAYRPSARPGRASCRASRSTSRATSRSQRVLVAPGRLLDQLGRDPRTTTSDRRECAPLGPIVGHEEVLDLGQHAVGHVSDGPHRWPDLRRLRGRDQPVVADRFAPLGLLGLDDAKHPGRDQTAREGGFFSQDQDIQGIAVLHPGAWNETEVEWEGRADGQELVEPEEPLPFVVLELAPAPRRGLDDHVHRPRASVSHTHSIPFHPSHGPGPPPHEFRFELCAFQPRASMLWPHVRRGNPSCDAGGPRRSPRPRFRRPRKPSGLLFQLRGALDYPKSLSARPGRFALNWRLAMSVPVATRSMTRLVPLAITLLSIG